MNDESRRLLNELLFAERYSCVIRNGDTIRLFRERGVRDLYGLLDGDPRLLDGAYVADKVVGKGAAALMVLGGIAELFADVVSRPALAMLDKAHVKVSYTICVPHIINRMQTDWCPIEKLCRECTTPEECRTRIGEFLNAAEHRPAN